MSTTTKWFAGLNALLGLWLIVAPFVFQPGTAALWNDVVVGALIALFGGYNTYAARGSAGSGRTTETGGRPTVGSTDGLLLGVRRPEVGLPPRLERLDDLLERLPSLGQRVLDLDRLVADDGAFDQFLLL